MRLEYHYSPLHVSLGRKRVFDYGVTDWTEPLTEAERRVLPYLEGVTGRNVDEDTYDACFKSILWRITHAKA